MSRRFSRRPRYVPFDTDRRLRDNCGVSEKHPYDAVGIRPDGDSFTVEVLGCQTEDEAKRLARHYADLWCSEPLPLPVRVHISSEPWAEDQMQFISRVEPDHREAK